MHETDSTSSAATTEWGTSEVFWPVFLTQAAVYGISEPVRRVMTTADAEIRVNVPLAETPLLPVFLIFGFFITSKLAAAVLAGRAKPAKNAILGATAYAVIPGIVFVAALANFSVLSADRAAILTVAMLTIDAVLVFALLTRASKRTRTYQYEE